MDSARGPISDEDTQARVCNTVYCVDEDLAMKVLHVPESLTFMRIYSTSPVMNSSTHGHQPVRTRRVYQQS